MLRFLRQYNKYLLAIFGSALMLVFLIEIVANPRSCGQGTENAPIGTLEGKKLTQKDNRVAGAELQLLARLGLPTPGTRHESASYLVMVRDAQRLGLEVSDEEARTVLLSLGLDEAGLIKLARESGATPDFTIQAVRHWITAQRYQALTRGLMPASAYDIAQALMLLREANAQINQIRQHLQSKGAQATMADQFIAMQQMQQIQSWVEARLGLLTGQPRSSAPYVARLVSDLRTNVKITAVPVDLAKYRDKAPTPTTAELEALFAAYRDNLPGDGKPYPFGFKLPDRVKIEYLSLPYARVLDQVTVEETEALAYYQAHRSQFVAPPSTQPTATPEPEKIQPYAAVRDAIILQLRQKHATELADAIIKDAQQRLMDNVRRLDEQAGYRVMPPDWQPTPLAQVAQALQQRYGILCDVVRKDAAWLDRQGLTDLPGIGASRLNSGAGQRGAAFPDYVLSVRELAPKPENPLISLRLQVGVPSSPLIDDEGSRYLFRVLAAEPTRALAKMDEDPLVLRQVNEAAEKVAAYQLMLADEAALLHQFRKLGPEALAQELKVQPITADFRRREMGFNGLTVPYIPGVGENEAFVDAVMAAADKAAALAAGSPLNTTPLDMRTLAVAVPARLTLYLVRIEDYQAMPRSEYEQIISTRAEVSLLARQKLVPTPDDEAAATQQLYKAAGFIPSHE